MDNNKLFDYETREKILLELKRKLKYPYSHCCTSTLGGKENVSMLLVISLDPQDKWLNGYIENSRYARFSIERDGTVENFCGKLGTKPMRKYRAKTIEALIIKLNSLA